MDSEGCLRWVKFFLILFFVYICFFFKKKDTEDLGLTGLEDFLSGASWNIIRNVDQDKIVRSLD